MRVVGIDPGTVSIDVCALEDGRLLVDHSLPTTEAVAAVPAFIDLIRDVGPVDLVVGPSGYGLPLTRASEATDNDLRLAYLAVEGERGGIGGLRAMARALGASRLPVVFTPGVVHLPTVPPHRKVNRVDMGTADKVCAAALAIAEQSRRDGCPVEEVSLVLLELGGAFTAVLAVGGGKIVDGAGGTSGPLGVRGAGALDGEVAFLAGCVDKALLFTGGGATIRGDDGTVPAEALADPRTSRACLAWDAYVESAQKAVAAMLVAVPNPREIVLTGRMAQVARVRDDLTRRLARYAPTRTLEGFARVAKAAAQGAALVADGLAGGVNARLVEVLGIREASGTALDHLYVISPDSARRRLGIT
jgi:predicted butyrate kinase (DUF1464 family)